MDYVKWVRKQKGLEYNDEDQMYLDFGVEPPERPPRPLIAEGWCDECSRLRVKINDGLLSCPECGDTQDGMFVIGQRGPTLKTKKRSEPIVTSRFVDGIAHDFSMVERVMKSEGLIKGRNLSKYDYYIIRLCSRVGTRPLDEFNDLKKAGRRRLDSTATFTG